MEKQDADAEVSEEEDEPENPEHGLLTSPEEAKVSESEDEPESSKHGLLASPKDIPRAFSPWSDDSDLSTDSDEDSRDAGSPVMTNSSLDGPKVDVAQVIDLLARLTWPFEKLVAVQERTKRTGDSMPMISQHSAGISMSWCLPEGWKRVDQTMSLTRTI